jgi:hypothetical protein
MLITKFNNYIILENSSLNKINIPKEVISLIEKDFEFSKNSSWKKTSLPELLVISNFSESVEKNNLFIQISDNNISVFTSNGKDKYIFDSYENKFDDFGDNWGKIERNNININEIFKKIKSNNLYYLTEGEFKLEDRRKRKIKEIEKKFDEINDRFLSDVIKYIKTNNPTLISYDITNSDSLTDLNRELINFEMKISRKLKKHLMINDIIEIFEYEKTKLLFIFYLKTKKIKI